MSDRSIIEAINKITGANKLQPVYYLNARVNSVDISHRLCNCTCIDGNTEFMLPSVKLMAVIDDGILIEPVIGSTVKIIFSQNVEAFVCQYSEIENITFDVRTKIKFNDGAFGGLIKIGELIKKINTVENDLNTLKKVFDSWIVAPSDGGAALKTISAAWTGQSITKTVISDLENTKITHG
jgi:hypothetical protein